MPTAKKKPAAEKPSPDARPTPSPWALSDRLRVAIVNAPCSQRTLSYKSGVAVAVISRFVARKRDINLATADRLAAALDPPLALVEEKLG